MSMRHAKDFAYTCDTDRDSIWEMVKEVQRDALQAAAEVCLNRIRRDQYLELTEYGEGGIAAAKLIGASIMDLIPIPTDTSLRSEADKEA